MYFFYGKLCKKWKADLDVIKQDKLWIHKADV